MKRITTTTTMMATVATLVTMVLAGCTPTSTTATATTATAAMPFHIERLTEAFDGVADEVIQVSGYTYVAVKPDGGDAVRWTATLKRPIAQGARVHVRSFGSQKDFKSRQLGRVFPQLWFAVVTVQQGGQS